MKLLTLNIWGGIVYQPLIKFIKSQGNTVNVFCFQEVFKTTGKKKISGQARVNVFQELQRALPKHHGYFYPAIKGINMVGEQDANLSFGLAMFIRRDFKVKQRGEIFVHKNRRFKFSGIGNMPRNLCYVLLEQRGKKYLIANMHGLWNGGPKTDTPDRIKQSQKVRKLLDKFSCPKIICGDFNLLPHTKSMAILDKGLVNLIKKFKIKSTRTRLYSSYKKHPLFADYIIVSPDIKVKNFKVLKNLVSDHAPLLADFN